LALLVSAVPDSRETTVPNSGAQTTAPVTVNALTTPASATPALPAQTVLTSYAKMTALEAECATMARAFATTARVEQIALLTFARGTACMENARLANATVGQDGVVNGVMHQFASTTVLHKARVITSPQKTEFVLQLSLKCWTNSERKWNKETIHLSLSRNHNQFHNVFAILDTRATTVRCFLAVVTMRVRIMEVV
jgi:hypothetical protein